MGEKYHRPNFLRECAHPHRNWRRLKNSEADLGSLQKSSKISTCKTEIRIRTSIFFTQALIICVLGITIGGIGLFWHYGKEKKQNVSPKKPPPPVTLLDFTVSTVNENVQELELPPPQSIPSPPTPPEPGETGMEEFPFEEGLSIDLEQYTLQFEKHFPNGIVERISDIMQRAEESLYSFIPKPNRSEKEEIKIYGDPYIMGAAALYSERVMTIGEDVSDGLIIHELVHLLHENNDLFVSWIEEGLASAISLLVTEKLGLESWDQVDHFEFSPSLLNGNLGQIGKILYEDNPPLYYVRVWQAAHFWTELEKFHPGIIAEFHMKYYAYLAQGGKKEDFELGKGQEILLDIDPSVATILQNSPVLNPRAPKKSEKNIYGFFGRLKDGTQMLDIQYVIRNPDTSETGISGKEALVSLTNPKTSLALQLTFETDEFGAIPTIVLFQEGGESIADRIGFSDTYAVVIGVDGQKEEFSIPFK